MGALKKTVSSKDFISSEWKSTKKKGKSQDEGSKTKFYQRLP